MEGIEHKMVCVNGINMHIAEKGEGPIVLLLHGFPELWYSWRHQIVELASLGYRAVAPDLRGFGDTDSPPSFHSYSTLHIVGDLIALIDALGQQQVIPSIIISFFSNSSSKIYLNTENWVLFCRFFWLDTIGVRI